MSHSEKTELRKQALRARRGLQASARDARSARISARLVRAHEFVAAQNVGCYLPMADEVDPSAIIERAWRSGKRLYVPVIDVNGEMRFHRLRPETALCKNRYGIWEPRSAETICPNRIDFVVVPLVAFDANCHRIGMGGGYYDRCFAFLKNRLNWQRPKLGGIAFDCQRVEKIELSPWDIPLYSVTTESALVRSKSS